MRNVERTQGSSHNPGAQGESDTMLDVFICIVGEDRRSGEARTWRGTIHGVGRTVLLDDQGQQVTVQWPDELVFFGCHEAEEPLGLREAGVGNEADEIRDA